MSRRKTVSFVVVMISVLGKPQVIHAQENADGPPVLAPSESTNPPPPIPSFQPSMDSGMPIYQMALQYFNENEPVENLPQQAAAIIHEVFINTDEIREKLWVLQGVIHSRKQTIPTDEKERFKISLLEEGLKKTLSDERMMTVLRDVGIIGATASLVALMSGLGFTGAAASRFLNARAERAAAAMHTVGDSMNGSGLRGFVTSVEHAMLRRFHPTPTERLSRALSRLGVGAGDVADIQKYLRPISAQEAAQLAGKRFYRTNRKVISVAAISPIDYSAREFGFFIFRLRPRRLISRKPELYYTTNRFPESQMHRIMSSLFYGRDRRVFVELVTERGVVRNTAVVADDMIPKNNAAPETAAAATKRFDVQRARRTFGGTATALSLGYAVSGAHSYKFRDVYLGSLLSEPRAEPPPSPPK